MELSPLRRVWVLLGVLVLAPGTSAAQQLSCPRVPDVAGMSHDVHSDIETRVGSLGKITGADLKVKTDVVAQNIYEKSPNLDRIAVTQMMLAVCQSRLSLLSVAQRRPAAQPRHALGSISCHSQPA